MSIPAIVINYDAVRSDGIDDAMERMIHSTREAVRKFGLQAASVASVLSPVDTGYMKSQIKHRVSQPKGYTSTVWVKGNINLETGAFYSIYVEYGTRHMRAQPFFYPAVVFARKEFKRNMREVFKP